MTLASAFPGDCGSGLRLDAAWRLPRSRLGRPGGGESLRNTKKADWAWSGAEDHLHHWTLTPGTQSWPRVNLKCPPMPHLASINDKQMTLPCGDKQQNGGRAPKITLTPITSGCNPGSFHKRRNRTKRRLSINLTSCKYESVRRAARRYGLKAVGEGDDWTLMWSDCSVSLDRVKGMKQYQINHFPGMIEICRKDTLARNLNRMLKLFPKDYNIFPRTWCLPADYCDFQAYTRVRKRSTFICKPDSGCQGRGIFITRSSRDIQPGEHMICQLYITRPLVMDGYKFDLRIYVLVTSCDPLRIFLFKEGLARFCTTKYMEPTHGNMDEVCMHLTNYSINKHKDNFIRDDNTGSKRKLTTLIRQLEAARADTAKLWCDIEDVIIKTLIVVQPVLKHNYRTCFPNHAAASVCFEILGFDVLLDQRLRPWLLEVNHSPSFTTDSQLDREVKDALLLDTLLLINLHACKKSKIAKEERLQENRSKAARSKELHQSKVASAQQTDTYESKHLGGFRRIFPREGGDKYDRFFTQGSTLVQATEASRARQECARQQLQELRDRHRDPTVARHRNSQGETAGEPSRRPGPRPAHRRPPVAHPRPAPVGTCEPEDGDDEEEEERVKALIQRKKLLLDMGLVQHIRQLLQLGGRDDRGPAQRGPPPAGKILTLDSLMPISEKSKTSPCVLASTQCSLRPSSTLRNFHGQGRLQLEDKGWSVGAVRVPGPGPARLPNLGGVPGRSPRTEGDPADLQGLLVTSTLPPLLRRPRLVRWGPQHGEGP
ncbi:tubulin polyglutamylase ttll6 isoform X2 [Syngnathoides biaculeatus]|uniref:tubulin polyglutamylase ttll6 isoform X2 n=1 Tax=Syngnathoides biaculeatus TaxID=300417 RepID=UPI002ADE5040|nr:tubulin polyglutamylase ttll6 isoform X2 [Syngnathoides biaculeatus]